MDSSYFYLLAAVQGIAEFLPISSSGHLVLLESLGGGTGTHNFFFFNILMHVATLLATMTFYRRDLLLLAVELFKESALLLKGKGKDKDKGRSISNLNLIQGQGQGEGQGEGHKDFPSLRFAVRIILTTAITGLIGISLKPLIEGFDHLGILSLLFLVNAMILWSSRKSQSAPEKTTLGSLSLTAALLIGLAQGIAVFPGISRSGITITAALLCGLSSREALKYSIFISIPIIIGAFLLEITDYSGLSEGHNYGIYAGTFLTSFAVGYVSLTLLFKIVRKHRIHLFALYSLCLALGLGVAFFWN